MVRPSGVFAFLVSRFWSGVSGLTWISERRRSRANCSSHPRCTVRWAPRLDGWSPVPCALSILAERRPARAQAVALGISVSSSSRMLRSRLANDCDYMPAMWRRRAVVGLRAEWRPETSAPPTLVHRLISLRMRSKGSFGRMCRQCSSVKGRAGGARPHLPAPSRVRQRQRPVWFAHSRMSWPGRDRLRCA
jgi:hypothetical protein